jgi:hypothetical protein
MRRHSKTTVEQPDESRRVRESAEETLARLQRYAAWLTGQQPCPADTLLPQPIRRRPRRTAPTAPLVLAALSCILGVLAFERFDNPAAAALSAALAVVGVIASLDERHAQGLGPSAVSLPA